MPATPPRVTVLGSMNMDISVTVPELPGPGATVLGSGARFAPGGKGGNQAVAAARLGAEVRMAGCVGHDEFGGQLLRALGAESVDTSAVREVQGVAGPGVHQLHALRPVHFHGGGFRYSSPDRVIGFLSGLAADGG